MSWVARSIPKARFYPLNFVLSAVVFGLITSLFRAPGGLTRLIISSVIFAAFMTVFIATMQSGTTSGVLRGAVPTARQSALLYVNSNLERVQVAAEAALAGLGRHVVSSREGSLLTLRVRRPMTFSGFGELVTVSLINGDSSQMQVSITSRPVCPLQIIDYGRGIANVAHVVWALEASCGAFQS